MVISAKQAQEQGVSSKTLHAAADWNMDGYVAADGYKDYVSARRFLFQSIDLREAAFELEKLGK